MLGCEHCDETKERLGEEGIEFTDLDIVVYENMWTDIVNETKSNTVPVLVIPDIENENNALVYLPNIDFNSVDELIDLIKK